MSRPDEYIIKLDKIKNKSLPVLIELYKEVLQVILEIELLPDYETAATTLEKNNLDTIKEDCIEDIEYFTNFIWE